MVCQKGDGSSWKETGLPGQKMGGGHKSLRQWKFGTERKAEDRCLGLKGFSLGEFDILADQRER